MSSRTSFQVQINHLLLKVGPVPVVLFITAASTVMSVLITGAANVIFMPHVPIEEWLYISVAAPIVITPVVSTLVVSLLYQLAEAREQLMTMTETDPLTGVGNRRFFMNHAGVAIDLAIKAGTPLSVVVIDIDHFKRINDEFGHSVGDAVLVDVAAACQAALRKSDLFARWGGEEFIVLLPDTDLYGAMTIAERLRESVGDVVVKNGVLAVTISLGVADLVGAQGSVDDVIARADRQMYLAKEAGRNRVFPQFGGQLFPV